jgi:hypothetical protein
MMTKKRKEKMKLDRKLMNSLFFLLCQPEKSELVIYLPNLSGPLPPAFFLASRKSKQIDFKRISVY